MTEMPILLFRTTGPYVVPIDVRRGKGGGVVGVGGRGFGPPYVPVKKHKPDLPGWPLSLVCHSCWER